MRKHWQTDWINFKLWEPIGLTTNSKKHAAVFNFPDYSVWPHGLYSNPGWMADPLINIKMCSQLFGSAPL